MTNTEIKPLTDALTRELIERHCTSSDGTYVHAPMSTVVHTIVAFLSTPVEPDEDQRRGMDAAIDPYRKQISDTPALMSLLHDIELLPEQIKLPVNVWRMIAVCILFKQMTAEQIATLFTSH